MIIVEGFDNSGKTTLVRELSGRMQLLVLNNRARPKSLPDIIDYVGIAVSAAKRFPCILDRFAPISEPVYGPICRGTNLLAFESGSIIMSQVFRHVPDLKVIYCRPVNTTILKFGEAEQMEGVIQNGAKLLSAYDTYIDQLSHTVPVIWYDWEVDFLPELLSKL